MNLHSPDVQVTDSNEALTYLKEGNARFVSDNLMPRNTNKKDLELTKDAQKPFAAIVTCADSRTTPEIFFDQKIGDLFVLRNAGNIADKSVLGSLEFGVKHLGVAVVVVVGHTMCGAVHTSHAGATGLSENLQAVLDDIRPHISHEGDKEDAAVANVKRQVEVLNKNKEIGAVPVLGAMYDIATGEVTWI
ncbi:MAG: carbonic anhydrase [Coriobacteriia bacterium]|nr:carbonic anhydrase [Coriobacteriia bacterium]MCL2870019.1 carbonic anhydrase [Coriobacteriia bacterium]